MTDDLINNNESIKAGDSNSDFLLFLILILILMGNGNSFNQHFELLNNKVNNLSGIISAFSATADGLKSAIEAPQNLKDNLNLQ